MRNASDWWHSTFLPMATGVMTQWAGPMRAAGWEYTEEFMMLWALSVAEARKHFSELVLVTDSYTARFMKDFPYDAVFTDLDAHFLPQEARSVWAAGKLIGFLRAVKQGKPFAHFDGDVLLRSQQRAFNAAIFAQSDEHFSSSPSGSIEENLRNIYLRAGCANIPVLPGFLRFSLTRDSHYPYNMGVCGGSDLEFWDEYIATALAILRHDLNLSSWGRIHPTFASLFIEQYLFGSLAEKRGKHIETLFPNSAAGNEEYMQSIGYIHLLGDSKTHEMAAMAIDNKLKECHPWMYEVVKSLCLHKRQGRSGEYGYYSS